jgi:hypothetical protein
MAVLILRSGKSGSRRPPTVREPAAICLEFPPEPSCAAARVWEKEPPPQLQTGQGPCMHTCPPADCECATAYQSARLKLGERHRRLIDMNTGPGSACCRCYDQPSTPHARVVIEAEWCARRREPCPAVEIAYVYHFKWLTWDRAVRCFITTEKKSSGDNATRYHNKCGLHTPTRHSSTKN